MEDSPVFAALADPVRRSLIQNLAAHSPRTATQLAAEYPISRQGIRKHLTILQDAGLVSVEQAGRDKCYSLTPAPFGDLEQWLAKIEILWDQRLARLKDLLETESRPE